MKTKPPFETNANIRRKVQLLMLIEFMFFSIGRTSFKNMNKYNKLLHVSCTSLCTAQGTGDVHTLVFAYRCLLFNIQKCIYNQESASAQTT